MAYAMNTLPKALGEEYECTNAQPRLLYHSCITHPHSHLESIHGPLHRRASCASRKFPIIHHGLCFPSPFVSQLSLTPVQNTIPQFCQATLPYCRPTDSFIGTPSEQSICWSNSVVCQLFVRVSLSLDDTSDLVVCPDTSPGQRVLTKKSHPDRVVRDSGSVATCNK